MEKAIVYPMPSSMTVRSQSDLFKHRYYRINRMLLKLVGQWPYQSARTRWVGVAVVILIAMAQVMPQTVAIYKHRTDWEFLVDSITLITFEGYSFTKFVFVIYNSKKMLRLLNRVRTDWNVWSRDRDAGVLHAHAENGRRITIVYTVVGCVTYFVFMTQPIVPKIIDVLMRNGTAPGEFAIPADYVIIDEQKYYFYVVLHMYASGFVGTAVAIAFDTLFMIYIQHGCGLYAALGHKLERIGKKVRSEETAYESDMVFENLSLCIDRHNEAIAFSELIEATYSLCYFFILGMNMLLIASTGLQLVTTIMEPEKTLRFTIGNICAMLHLYAVSTMAQMLMDHSFSIRNYIMNSEWYRLPLKTQRILLLMIMRCNVPCKITAGKVTTMSMQTFSVCIRTSMSYFTLMRSI